MDKKKIGEKLDMLRKFVIQSESYMRLGKIPFRKYQEDRAWVNAMLDEIEEEINPSKGRSLFDRWFGNPLKSIDNNFNDEVHKAIEDIYADGENNL